MILESVTIVLPLLPKVLSPNCAVATPGGRFAKAAATKKCRRLTEEAIVSERIDSSPWQHVKVHASFFYKDERRRDADNAVSSLKAVYDGIVDSGLVSDDTQEYMTRYFPKFFIDRCHPRVELTITRLQ